MGFSLLPREVEYFSFFSQMTEKITEAAKILVEMMESEADDLSTYSRRIKDAEHGCDQVMHAITTKLNKSFITPFDREDIYSLSISLDDVCDYIDAGARAIMMYDIHKTSEYSRRLARVIVAEADEIHAAVAMLHKPNGMNKHFVEIHRLENEADDIYFKAMADLFKNSSNPIHVIKWKELYDTLENATDKCETVANIIESIVLKHH
jgi:predicted phosphate transport protein (TIGR00153 family)